MKRSSTFLMNGTNCPSFTVNNALTSVPLTGYLVENLLPTNVNTTNFRFANNEFIVIKGYGIALPEYFILADQNSLNSGFSAPALDLYTRLSTGVYISITGSASDATFRGLPLVAANYVHEWYWDSASLSTSYTYNLIGTLDNTQSLAAVASISMIGVPDSLNGMTFFARPFVVVEYTNNLVP